MTEIIKRAAQKTFKREASSLLMLWLLGLATYAFVSGDHATRIEILKIFLVPIGVMFAGAYGLDWVGKHTHWGGPPTGAPPEKREGPDT